MIVGLEWNEKRPVHAYVCVSGCRCSGVSLKIMRMFRCVEVEGVSWLAADMRLQCYTSEWIAYGLTPTPSWHRVP